MWSLEKAFLGLSIGGMFLAAFCCLGLLLPVESARPTLNRRDASVLLQGRVTTRTKVLRTKLLEDFQIWLRDELPGWPVESLARDFPSHLSEWLSAYISWLFTQGRSRLDAAETLNMIVQTYGWMRPQLNQPWSMIRTWDSLQPTQHHLPVPQKVLHGMLAVCIAWNWPKIGILLALGFYGLLRPIELLSLKRKDVVLPTEHLEGDVIFLRIHNAKTRFRAAAAQHVRIDSWEAVTFVNLFLPQIPRWQTIWSGSYAAFRRRFDLLQTAVVLSKPFMPSSLRPGGATFLFRHWNENLPRLQWRGRWKSFRMLETYIQELGAAEVLAAFTPLVLSRIVVLHDFFEALLA